VLAYALFLKSLLRRAWLPSAARARVGPAFCHSVTTWIRPSAPLRPKSSYAQTFSAFSTLYPTPTGKLPSR
jgi:hypothetical protein